MVDNKPIDAATSKHLQDVDEKYEDRAEATVGENDELQAAYEARSKAYSDGQEEIEAKRKEAAAPYEKLSDLVDEHAEKERESAEKSAEPRKTSKKK